MTTVLSAFHLYHHAALVEVIVGQSTSRLATVLIGLTEIYLAFNLRQYKRVAMWSVSIMSVFAFFVQHLQHAHPAAQILPLLLLALLLATQDYYRVRSEPLVIVAGIRRALIIIALAVLIGTFALWEISPIHFGVDFDILPAIHHSVAIVLLGQNDIHPHTRLGRQFLETLHLLGIVSYGFVLYSLFRPLYDRFVLTPHNLREVEHSLSQYGKSSEDIFKVWPADKSYFFADQHMGFVAYKVARGCAIALANPICAPHVRQEFIAQFADYCQQHGWLPVFIQIEERYLSLYQQNNYADAKIGECAVVNLAQFTEKTARNKHFRNIGNRFTKQGYRVEFSEPAHTPELLRELRTVSDSWLTLPGRTERGFGMGTFDDAYMQMSQIALLRDAEGNIVAFVNQQPNYSKQRASIDLMRHRADAPPNVMDFLLLQLLLHTHHEGWREFDLGLVPLAGVGREKDATLYERFLSVFYIHGDRVFAFQGLYRFKNKFEPMWEGSYLAYRGGQAALPKIALALAKIFTIQ